MTLQLPHNGGMLGPSFIRASAWSKPKQSLQFTNLSTNPRYSFRNQHGKGRRRKNFGQRVQKFHLFDFYNHIWNPKITNPPILLTHAQVLNWKNFRYKDLVYDQLYLWQANEFDWVPLYTTNAGFLMIEKHFMRYDDVSYDQLCNQSWTWQNKISNDRLKIILQKFNISFSSIDKVGLPTRKDISDNPFVNGQHFYGPVVKDNQTSLFNAVTHN